MRDMDFLFLLFGMGMGLQRGWRDPFSGLRRVMGLARSCRVAADRLQMSECLFVDRRWALSTRLGL